MNDTNRNYQVSLGCGTLILIALIVAIFSGRGEIGELEDEVRELRNEIEELRSDVQAQSGENQKLREMLNDALPLHAAER